MAIVLISKERRSGENRMAVEPFHSSQESLPGRGRCSHWGACWGQGPAHPQPMCRWVRLPGTLGSTLHLSLLSDTGLAYCLHSLGLLLWGLGSHRQDSTPIPVLRTLTGVPPGGSPSPEPFFLLSQLLAQSGWEQRLTWSLRLPFLFLWAEPSVRVRGRNLA